MKTLAVVPISVTIPGNGTVRFPKELRGKVVPEGEFKRLWAKFVKPYIPKPAMPRS